MLAPARETTPVAFLHSLGTTAPPPPPPYCNSPSGPGDAAGGLASGFDGNLDSRALVYRRLSVVLGSCQANHGKRIVTERVETVSSSENLPTDRIPSLMSAVFP